jgi:NADH-quinone oxidoreductase subunit A
MTELVVLLLIFLGTGLGFLAVNLLVGRLVRPHRPDPEKESIYECGEPTIGSSWIQFDLRFYVVALLFVIFDVEMAFFFPWATVFGSANTLTKDNLTAEQRIEAQSNILPTERSVAEGTAGDQQAAAKRFAWVAFADIVVFFGVLLVGFAYLWKRGDLDWVRSTEAQNGNVENPMTKTETNPNAKIPMT